MKTPLLAAVLLRGSNAVGYTSYPDNLVRAFVLEAARGGIDIFRIFDSLNWPEQMQVAIDAVRESGKVAEVSLCYSGDLANPASRGRSAKASRVSLGSRKASPAKLGWRRTSSPARRSSCGSSTRMARDATWRCTAATCMTSRRSRDF